MKKYDVIIIGAGPAAIVTGMTARKQYPEKSMLMIKEEEKGLVPCGIPYVFHELDCVEKNQMGPKGFIDAGGEVLLDRATGVDTEAKTVSLESGQQFSYEKLVFATGSLPLIPTFIKGYDLENVFYIKKSYKYIESLHHELKKHRQIIVVGGGFIGAEVAEQLALDPEKTVTLVETEKQCFSKAFSPELSAIATEELRKTGVKVLTNTRVEEVLGSDGLVSGVRLNNGEQLDAGAVIMAIGYRPRTELAQEAGLPVNKTGAIIVDSYERTNVEGVCAVGDCSQTLGFLTGRMDYIMLASTATAEARVLGYNLFKIRIKKNSFGTLGVFSTKINHFTLAAAGVNEQNASEANIDFISASFSDVNRHPGTLPDTEKLSVKLYCSPADGSILGGEAWGAESAGEIINIISMAIQKSVTVYEMVSFQVGTHPLLTGAPTKYSLIKAAENVIAAIGKR